MVQNYAYFRTLTLAHWLMLIMILLGCTYSTTSHAGSTVALRESFAGNLSFSLTGGSFRTTQNNQSACTYSSSSSNPLTTIPATASIKQAYLYWAGSTYNTTYADSTVYLNGQLINADRTYTDSSGSSYYYSGVADITSQVSSTRNGTYTVSGLYIYSNYSRCSTQTVLGGWSILVIYEDSSEDFNVLNVYEGFQYFQQDATYSSLTLTPSNFKLPANPSGQHAHITWEGDDTIGSDGEGLTFEGYDLYDSISGGNSLGNQFDSYSNIEGGLTTYGVDIDSYDISAYLTEGATSVSTTYTARQDGVLLSAEVIKVSNIPVADLSITTSEATGWTQGSSISKKLTISNNGPNDVPTNSVRFTTTLPDEFTFDGTQGNSDWVCTQNGQDLSCIYQNKLRSGWSDYLDISLTVANGTAGQDVDWSMSVDHDTAPYDIFDNHEPNDTFVLSVPIVSNPVVDLSASSKTYSNLSGDSLLAGDTLQYTIIIDDTSSLATSGIQLYDDLPANISGFNIISIPPGAVSNSPSSGGANGTGYLNIQNIYVPADGTAEVIFEVYVDSNAPEGTSLQNQAEISYNGTDWIVDTGDITVVEPDLSPSTITLTDNDGGLLEAGDVIDVTITLEDANALETNDLQVTGDIPSFISQFQILSTPSGSADNSLSVGGSNGSGYLDISNIDFAAGETPSITLRLTIDPSTPEGTEIDMSNLLSLGSKNWTINSNTLQVMNNTPAATGNKQLYLSTSNTLSRLRPNDGELDIADNSSVIWTLTPALQSDFTFDLTNITAELKFEGNRYRNNGSPRSNSSDVTLELRHSDGTLLADDTFEITLTPGEIDSAVRTLTKNTSISGDEITLSAGDSLYLSIYNDASGNGTNRRITLHILDGIDTSLKADGYSAITLDASTVINVDSIEVWSTPFNDTDGDYTDDSGATLLANSQADTTLSIRANVSDPFGAFDINQAEVTVQKTDGSYYDFSGNNTMTAIDDPSDDNSSASKRFEKTITLAEDDEILGGWSINVTAYEGVEGDVEHTNIKGFTIIPFMPNITLTKTIEVINDPINGLLSAGNKPKAIPGAELKYTIHAVNTGRGDSDNNSIKLQDEIPANSELYIGDVACTNRGPGTGSGPVCFEDGSALNESELTFDFLGLTSTTDHLFFSQDGVDFDYEPVDNGDGYDPSIRYIRIAPSGAYKQASKDGTQTPEFSFSYQVRLQ